VAWDIRSIEGAINFPIKELTSQEIPMGMSFMMLLILGGGVILVLAIVVGIVAMALSSGGKDRDRDDRR
jgi:uncharacterized protein YqhQ